MTYVDPKLFSGEHYMGKPANYADRIVARRVRILESFPEFLNTKMDCVEIGCGNGASMELLKDRFRIIDGIELFEGHKAEFEEMVQRTGAGNLSFRALNIEKESIGRTYDRLISFEVIEHLESEDSVSAYAKALNSGGLAAISVPNKWWIFETHGARLPGLPWNRVPFFSWLPRPLHERWANARIYTRRRIVKLMEKHGFEVLKTCYVTAPMDVLREGRLKRFIISNILKNDTTGIPFFSTSVMLLARKR